MLRRIVAVQVLSLILHISSICNSPEPIIINLDRINQAYSSSVNAGDIWGGKIITQEYEILNNTNYDLEVIETKKSCSCIVTSESSSSLSRSQKSKLVVRFDTNKSVGHRFVVIKAQLSQNITINISINMNVIELFPNYINRNMMLKGHNYDHAINIVNVVNMPQILDVSTSKGLVKVAHLIDGKNQRLMITFDGNMGYGDFSDEILLRLYDGTAEITKHIRVEGRVAYPVEIDRARVFFGGTINKLQGKEQISMFSPYNKKLPNISIAFRDGNKFTAEMKCNKDMSKGIVEISVNQPIGEQVIISDELIISGSALGCTFTHKVKLLAVKENIVYSMDNGAKKYLR